MKGLLIFFLIIFGLNGGSGIEDAERIKVDKCGFYYNAVIEGSMNGDDILYKMSANSDECNYGTCSCIFIECESETVDPNGCWMIYELCMCGEYNVCEFVS